MFVVGAALTVAATAFKSALKCCYKLFKIRVANHKYHQF